MEVSRALDLSSLLAGPLPSMGAPAADTANSTKQALSQFSAILTPQPGTDNPLENHGPLYFSAIFQQLVSTPEEILKPGLSYETPGHFLPELPVEHAVKPLQSQLPEVDSSITDPLLQGMVKVNPVNAEVTDTIKEQLLTPAITEQADTLVNMEASEIKTTLPGEQVRAVELQTLSTRLAPSPVKTEFHQSTELPKAAAQVNVELALNQGLDGAKGTDNDFNLTSQVIKEKPTGHYENLLTETLAKRQFSAIEQHPNLNPAKDLGGDKPVSYSSQIEAGAIDEAKPLNPLTERQPEKFTSPSSMDMKLKDFQTFPSSMGERLAWLVNKEQRLAQIRLDPPELGRLQIALSVDGDQVSVQFHASGTAVKDLILQQVERLRIAMASHDLNLVNVNVSTGGDSQSGAKYQLASTPSSVSSALVDDNPSDAETLDGHESSSSGYGLLDTFA